MILRPFDDRFSISSKISDRSSTSEFFEKNYEGKDNEWHQIDENWSDMVGELALKLDKHTNNTCLAMAIELVKSRKVLLFPRRCPGGQLAWLA